MLSLFSCVAFSLFVCVDNKAISLTDFEKLEGAGELIGKGIGDGLGDSFREGLAGVPEETTIKIFEGMTKGVLGASKEGSNNLAKALAEFGKDSEFNNELSKTSRAIGSAWASALDGVGDHLLPFIAKNGLVVAGSITAMATAYYGTRAFWNYMQHRLINPPPKVIIESSRQVGLFGRLKNWVFGAPKPPQMIFAPELEERLDNLVVAAQNINAKIKAGHTNVKYRNIVLYGPSGTGKTMFARQLAKQSNMEFVVVTGSSFFQEGAGIKAIDELFSWANKKKGLCIFIDEADSLLASRDVMKVDSENYRLVNHFLNYLGERSDKFMVIVATNYLRVFDEAMQRRLDDVIKMPMPRKQKAPRTKQLSCDTNICDVKQNGQEFVDAVNVHLTDCKLQQIASKTEGFSYGDLSGIFNTIKSDADITDDGLVTSELIDTVVCRAIEKKQTFNKINHAAPQA